MKNISLLVSLVYVRVSLQPVHHLNVRFKTVKTKFIFIWTCMKKASTYREWKCSVP